MKTVDYTARGNTGVLVGGEGGSAFSLDDQDAYCLWRREKLMRLERAHKQAPTPISNPQTLTRADSESLLAQIADSNLALYRWDAAPSDEQDMDEWLLAFASQFGLCALEDHRSANHNGVVRIENAQGGGRGFYIPYTDKAISWHTDGYYNYHGQDRAVRAMALHCARQAREGGENRLLDHELAYIRMRDEGEAALRLLFHPQAMTIPEATDDAGRCRAQNTGPVFFVDAAGRLAMRYTARKKFVDWRDGATRKAAETLLALIDSEPLARRVKMTAGEGVLCNNVLHDRASFRNGDDSQRLLCRIRFHNVIDLTARN